MCALQFTSTPTSIKKVLFLLKMTLDAIFEYFQFATEVNYNTAMFERALTEHKCHIFVKLKIKRR